MRRTGQVTPSLTLTPAFIDIMDEEMIDTTAAHAADTEFLVRKAMVSGYHLFSFLVPPVYAAFTLSRYGRSNFSVNRLLRATWIGGAGGTQAISAPFDCF